MRLLSLDTESCTGGVNDGSLCSIGYALFDEQMQLLEQKDILINPLPEKFRLCAYGKPAEIQFSYTEAEFRAAPRFSGVYEQFKGLFDENTVVLGFSFSNDIRYINNACEKFGLPRIPFKYLDVQTIYALYVGKKEQRGLSKVAEEFGITFAEHRSDEDARATGLILKNIMQKLNLTLPELIKKYGLSFGSNGLEPKGMTSAIYESQKYDKNLKPVKKILIDIFKGSLQYKKVVNKNFKYANKCICFAEDIEYDNVDYFRSLIKTIMDKGVKCIVRDVDECNVFVRRDDAFGDRYFKASGRLDRGDGITIVDYTAFMSEVGEVALLDFPNDKQVLQKYYAERERIKREKQLLKKTASANAYKKVFGGNFSFSVAEKKGQNNA